MPGKTSEERLDRLEAIVEIIAEDQMSLQKIVTAMATANRESADFHARQAAETERRLTRLDEQMRLTDERMRQTDERMRQTDERMRRTDEQLRGTDERIGKLVVAMGEFIRRPN
jgi:peptidoglycan hydrolase CwlO-like protein